MKVIAGCENPNAGEVRLDGPDLQALPHAAYRGAGDHSCGARADHRFPLLGESAERERVA
jgi:hypothetical protein